MNKIKAYKDQMKKVIKANDSSEEYQQIEAFIVLEQYSDALERVNSQLEKKTDKNLLLLKGIIQLKVGDFKQIGKLLKEIKQLEDTKAMMQLMRCGTCAKFKEKKTCSSCSFYSRMKDARKESDLSRNFLNYIRYEIARDAKDTKRMDKYLEKIDL